MRVAHSRVPATVLTLLLLAGSLTARQRPDFTGTWVATSPAEAAGRVQTIKQTETMLTHGHDSSGGGHSFTYKFDGSESRFVIHGTTTIATASWDNDKLVIVERANYHDGRVRNAKFVWSINAQGERVVDFTEQFNGQPAKTMRIISRRTP
jgi:hypothetical protein